MTAPPLRRSSGFRRPLTASTADNLGDGVMIAAFPPASVLSVPLVYLGGGLAVAVLGVTLARTLGRLDPG